MKQGGIIACAVFWLAEGIIRKLDLPKHQAGMLLLMAWSGGPLVWVPFASQSSVCLLELRLRGVELHSQRLVVVVSQML